MRRTIATMLLLAGWATASLAYGGEEAESATTVASPVAQYHLGDADEGAAAKPAASKAKGEAQKAAYNQTQSKEPIGLTGFEVAAGDGGMSCTQSCCNPCCNTCCCNDCFCNAGRIEYLLWFTRGRNTPPLVTTSPQGTPQAQAGVLGFGTTDILYGSDPIGTDIRNGMRLSLSHLLNDECTWVDGRFWGLEDSSETFAASSPTGDPILAIPFFDALLNVESAYLVAFPNAFDNSSLAIRSKNDLIGGDLYVRRTWRQGCHSHIDLLGGYMFTRMDDSLFITATSTSQVIPSVGTVTTLNDSFRTQNEFNGGQAGFLAVTSRNCLSLEILGKMAIGNMHQTVIIDGSRTATPFNGAPTTVAGGLFTQPSNIGNYERDRFAFVPEVNVNLAYQVNCNWKVMMGYTFIYWSNVVLAGNQIDRNVNLAQLTTPPNLPAFNFARTDFWAQGLSFGAQYQW